MIRSSLVFVVAGLLLAAVLYDQVSSPVVADDVETVEQVITPSVSEPARLDGAWFCPMGTSSQGGFADHTVHISNLSDEAAVANVGVLTGDGKGPTLRVPLAPLSTQDVPLASIAQADTAGAVVEIIGGTGVVGHSLDTEFGPVEGPCATQVASTWFFASGRTTADSLQYLALMNPFPQDVVYNIELFRSAGRPRRPAELQGEVVPANSVRIIDLHEFVRREDAVAASITTIRGRLVAERLQTADGERGPKGAALQIGVATPATSWMLAAGRIHDGGDDRVIVFNPSVDETATINLDLWPINPTDRSLYGLGAIPRELLPGRFEIVDLRLEAERFGLRLPYEVGVSVTSTNGVAVVAERWQFANEAQLLPVSAEEEAEPDEDADDANDPDAAIDPDDPAADDGDADAAPADDQAADGASAEGDDDEAALDGDGENPQETGELDVPGILGGQAEELVQPTATTGIATSRGTEVLSNRWIIPWVSTPADNATAVIVTSPEDASVEVFTLVNGQFVGPIRESVLAGGRVVIPLPTSSAGVPVLVIADANVSVEAQVVFPGVGMAVVPGVPTING